MRKPALRARGAGRCVLPNPSFLDKNTESREISGLDDDTRGEAPLCGGARGGTCCLNLGSAEVSCVTWAGSWLLRASVSSTAKREYAYPAYRWLRDLEVMMSSVHVSTPLERAF